MIVSGAGCIDEDRLDLHNSNVDQLVARSGRCGTADLTSGRVCILTVRHPGPCQFVPGHIARAGGRR